MNITIETIKNHGYTLHHTASQRGYLSRKGGDEVIPYKGHFGEGYKVLSPRWDTTQYVRVSYYTKEVLI